MNNFVKICLIILVTIIIHPWKLYSSELVITIPDKYNNKSLPLPPFPKESVSDLTEMKNHDTFLDTLNLRLIPLEVVTYRYLPEFLDFNITMKSFTEHIFYVGSDLSCVDLTYDFLYYNNLMQLRAGGGYLFSESMVDLRAQYHIYNIPIDFMIETSLLGETANISLGNRNYYNRWSFTLGYDTDAFDMTTLYESKKFFNTELFVNYHYPDTFSGTLIGGVDALKLGVTTYDNYFYPNVDAKWDVSSSSIILDSEFSNSFMYYYTGVTGLLNNHMSLYVGVKSIEYDVVKPYLKVEESLLWGRRSYVISEEELIFELNFINNRINSIISINITPFEDFTVSTEFVWDNKWSLSGEVNWNESDLSYKLGFEYILEDL